MNQSPNDEHYRDRIVRAIEFKPGALSFLRQGRTWCAARLGGRMSPVPFYRTPARGSRPTPYRPPGVSLPCPPPLAFLSPWRFYGNGARTESSAISGGTKLLADDDGGAEETTEREADRRAAG